MGYIKKKFELPESIDATELDLAPLLSIMVKLIPVLLLSTAFVHITTIDSDLPRPIKAAIQASSSQLAYVEVKVLAPRSFEIEFRVAGRPPQVISIAPATNGNYDWVTLNQKLIEIKEQVPSTFTLFVKSDDSVSYEDIIRLIDYARKPIIKGKTFVYQVHEGGQAVSRETDFMFPDVQFADAALSGS